MTERSSFFIFAGHRGRLRINLVVQTHPISSALSLIGVMGRWRFCTCCWAREFIAAAQMIVYAGAIMVLFVFVIMLLNAGAEGATHRESSCAKYFGIPLAGRVPGLDQLRDPGHAAQDAKALSFGAFHGGTARRSAKRCSPIICCRSKSLRF